MFLHPKLLIWSTTGSERETHRLGPRGAAAVRAVVAEEDIPGLGDGGGLVEVHQLVEGGELLRPQEVHAFVVSHHFEVLDVTLVPEGRRKHSALQMGTGLQKVIVFHWYLS